ncbi:hypothetical protein [Granulicella mallensis]|uniref:YMGG-like Gly-zipper domain-containing protein n=1 Tax=Granulicella mallensis TaxID=940614 RepID=A0A7W8E8X2_9BACT|nr:hypothetical protein [Granulicella mallensis]MBB5063888.1 hypothetical protein [Granulicella mallensis]
MAFTRQIRFMAGAGLITLALLAGCKNKEQQALDQAKAQATSTNTPQQINYVDANGNSVTTTVQAPVAGQGPVVQTSTTPPPAGTKPHQTDPVITVVGAPPAGGQMVGNAPVPNDGSNGAMSPQGTMSPQGNTSQQNESVQSAAAASQPAQPSSASPAAPLQLTVPAGTDLSIRVNQRISVKTSRTGDRFSGEVVEPVVQGGTVVIPRGTPVSGRVDASHRRGHFKGSSILELRLTSMTLNGNQYGIDTHDNVRTKRGKGRRSSGFIGGMTGAGMLIGGIATGGVGLAIGGAAGAGAGTLIAGTTGNRDIVIPAESIVRFRLADQLVVQNP